MVIVAGAGQFGFAAAPVQVVVRGQPIDRWCDERRLGIDARLRLFVDMVLAVAAAHAQLVVHRDIKPGNVMVDEQGQAKLLDFGIARLLDEGEDGAPQDPTRTGQRAFTPAWAAPEQMRSEPLSTATDVWALGVLLCQLLTGRHASGLPWASDLTAWMRVAALPHTLRPSRLAAAGDEAVALAAARGTQPLRLARRLQGELDQIVLRALAEEPGRRYASAQALADDVLRHLRNEPVSAVADTVGYRATKFVRRNRLMVGAASTTVLAQLAGVVGTTWQALEARAQRDAAQSARAEAVAQAQRAVRERDAAEATDEFLGFLLTSTPGQPTTAKELLTRGGRQALQQFKDAPLVQARLLLGLADLYKGIDEPDRMVAVLDSARQATAAAGPEAVGLRALADCVRASNLAITPSAAAAEAVYGTVLPVLRNAHAEPTLLVGCLAARSLRTIPSGAPPEAAVDQYREALQLMGTPRPGQRALFLEMQLGLAWSTARLGDLGRGLQALRDGLRELEQMGRGQTAMASTWINNLAFLETQAGQPLVAPASMERAIAVQGRVEVPVRRTNLARQQFMLGRTKEALDNGERGRGASRISGDLFNVAMFDAAYAGCPAAVGRTACRQRREDSRRLLQQSMPPTSPMFARFKLAIGQEALAHGEVKAAHLAFTKSIEIFDASQRAAADRILAATMLSRTEAALGLHESALKRTADTVLRATSMSTAVAANGLPHSAWLGQALLAQAVVQRAAGQTDNARQSAEKALPHLLATMGERAPETREAVAFLSAR